MFTFSFRFGGVVAQRHALVDILFDGPLPSARSSFRSLSYLSKVVQSSFLCFSFSWTRSIGNAINVHCHLPSRCLRCITHTLLSSLFADAPFQHRSSSLSLAGAPSLSPFPISKIPIICYRISRTYAYLLYMSLCISTIPLRWTLLMKSMSRC